MKYTYILMALTQIILFVSMCLAAVLALPQDKMKNTIFLDETLVGEIFEDRNRVSNKIDQRDNNTLYRLPKVTKPNKYSVLWSVDFSNFSFEGTVIIELEATEEDVREIVIHSENLNILSTNLTQAGNSIPVNILEQSEYSFLIIQLNSGVLDYNATNPVVYSLTLNFEGLMRDDTMGIYKSWYKTNGTTRWMATTQFAATAARSAFPCYDEPGFKAHFDIIIRRPIGYKSWFCTRLASTTTSTIQGYEDDHYYTTPYMSTYVVAFIVAEYESLPVFNDQNQLMYEVIGRPDAINAGQGQYALDIGQELLTVMTNHTLVDYFSMDPNLKMTQASIPDLGFVAMENWGLLTYREIYLMYDSNHTNNNLKYGVASLLSHEISHMWFGNLVTCAWWDVVWLNEGFADYYQYYLTHWMANIPVIALQTLFLAAVLAYPQENIKPKNTIFLDERLVDGIFNDENSFDNQIAQRNDDSYRLPTTTKPNRYSVIWSIDFSNFSFGGSVSIELEATQENVNEIVIHSENLNLLSTVLTQAGANIPVSILEQTEYNFLIIQLNTGVLAYNASNPIVYTLTMNFEGFMRNDMYGIYSSWFQNNGSTRWMASTQFQPTAARSAFPCYDEPGFKAYFDITVRRPIAYRSWSCTRLASTNASIVQGYEDDVYFTTPYMSTYLLAFIVAEYENLEVYNDQNQLIYEIIARPDAINNGQGQFALEVGQELLAEMIDHTSIDFFSMDPNLKMTQASIPDFGAGAMENWGLLTYREIYLMYDSNHTNNNLKYGVASLLSHEIAHMWFGNLVTCDWWDVLWLNEGFAQYYQFHLTHWVEDYMGLNRRFINEQVHAALLADSANNPQPLTNPGVYTPTDISNMFSTISYSKGASVIRMTENLLGFAVHLQGLRNYLVQKSYSLALPIDLFQALQDVAISSGAISEYGDDFSLIDYYVSWTEQPGHPVLNVQVNHQTGDMIIQQRRFNINTGYSEVATNYIIPITFSTASNPDFSNTKPSHIIKDTVTVINRGSVGDEWVIFNRQQTGFYRVNYDDYTWDLIILALRGSDRTLIHEYNRAQILNDVFQYARSGLMTYNRAFNIISFLENESDYVPWITAITGFNWILNRLAGTSQLDDLHSIIINWSSTVMSDLGYYPDEDETYMRSYLRWQMARFLCNLGVQECRDAAVAQFAALRNEGQDRAWVYCNALREGTVEDFEFLWQRFLNHHVYSEKNVILLNLGCTPHESALATLMNAIIEENEIVRSHDYYNAYNGAVTGSEANTQAVFRYIQNNLQAVSDGFGSIATPLSYIASRLRSEQEIEQFETWVQENANFFNDNLNTILNLASASRESIQWAQSVADDINSYIDNGDDDITTTTEAEIDVDITTVSQPDIEEPVTPTVPDSATTLFVSAGIVLVSVLAHLIG